MDICFEGVGQVAATFQVEGEVQPGMAVALVKSGTVGLGTAGTAPCGVALGSARGGAIAVQIGGVAKVGYSGTAPAVGWQELVCDGEGGVKVAVKAATATMVSTESNVKSNAEIAADGLKCLVLAVDETEKTAVVKL